MEDTPDIVTTITIDEIITDNGVTIRPKETFTVPVYMNNLGHYESMQYGQDFLTTPLHAEDVETLTDYVKNYIGFVWDEYANLEGILDEKQSVVKTGMHDKYEVVND